MIHISLCISLLIIASLAAYSQTWQLGGNPQFGANGLITNSNDIGSQAGQDYWIDFVTNGANRMFINQQTSSGTFGGYVGIGNGFLPNSTSEPLTRLHIGYPDNLYAVNGWRPWMKEGLFVHKGSDIAYFGLMDTSISDRQDAIISWGDNMGDQGAAYGPDFLRVIFNERSAGAWANGYYGKEVMRYCPDSRIGMGVGFNPAVLPGAHLDVFDDGTTPAGAIPQLRLTYSLNANAAAAVRADFLTLSTGDHVISPQNGTTEKNLGVAATGVFTASNPPMRKLEVLKDANEPQFRISRNYAGGIPTAADFQVTNAGHLIINPFQNLTLRRVGIGSFSQANPPQRKLDVIESSAQLRLSYSSSGQAPATATSDFQTNSSGYLGITTSGGRIGLGGVPTVGSGTHIFNTLRVTPVPGAVSNPKFLVIDATTGDVGTSSGTAGGVSACGSGLLNNYVTKVTNAATNEICNSQIYDDGNLVFSGGTYSPLGFWNIQSSATQGTGGTGFTYSLYVTNDKLGQTAIKGTSSGIGVFAECSGTGSGVSGYGMYSIVSATGNTTNYGVHSDASGATNNIGTWSNASNAATSNIGVQGRAQNGSGQDIGVNGIADQNPPGSAAFNVGVQGNASSGQCTTCSLGSITTLSNVGVIGLASTGAGTNVGVYGNASGGAANFAGFFDGPVYLNGQVTVNGSGTYTGTWTLSDSSLKNDVQQLQNPISIINQLKPSTYYFDSTNTVLNLPSEKQYGFIAQDVEEVLPDLVRSATFVDSIQGGTGSATVKTINYIEFIPLIVSALQHEDSLNSNLQSQLTALQLQLNSCCSANQGMRSSNPNDNGNANQQTVELKNVNAIILDQNAPNPFAENTVITYNIPAEVSQAQILFFDNNGRVLKEVDITGRGAGSLQVYASDLSDGNYSYSLIADGKLIDTKKMVKQH